MLPLRLVALGPPEVHMGDSLLAFPTRKTLALLIYLAVEAGPQPREHLAALLWPEAKPERSYASLRNTLGHLQTAWRQASSQAPTSYLSVTHNALSLNPDANITRDLRTVEQAYALARDCQRRRRPAA
jgi:DNA-binding SARP family transcriptional activator